jgi:hypothetical protein
MGQRKIKAVSECEAATTPQPSTAVDRLYGMVPWKGDLDEFDRWLNDPDEGQWGNRDI